MSVFSIYMVECDDCSAKYVGSTSKSVEERMGRHFGMLASGKHYNAKMSECHAGDATFTVSVLEECAAGARFDSERSWAIAVRSNVQFGGMNMNFGLGGGLGEDASMSKITEDIAAEIKMDLCDGVLTHQQIADAAGISKASVSDIARASSWAWVHPELNEELIKRAVVRQGSSHRNAKKNEADVAAMKEMLAAGASMREARLKFGYSSAHATRIASGEIWGHVRPDLSEALSKIDFRAMMPHGANSKTSKLTESEVSGIKERLASGTRPKQVAEETGIGYPMVWQIFAMKNWIKTRSDLNDNIREFHSERMRNANSK